MKALADENFPHAAIRELRRLGWDIVAVQEWRPSTDDLDVAWKAREEGRLLLTFDKDFGELWQTGANGSSAGIVLFRLPRLSAAETIDRIVSALTSRSDWSGFWVIEADRVRARTK
jgi:predicted nuclease of predicted toxin-antitoxin system